MRKPAYNPTDRPVVIDDDGHTLGGREWGAADPDSDRVAQLVDAGELVLRDQLPDGASPEIRAAVDAAMGPVATTAAAPAGEGQSDPDGSTPPPATPDTKKGSTHR